MISPCPSFHPGVSLLYFLSPVQVRSRNYRVALVGIWCSVSISPPQCVLEIQVFLLRSMKERSAGQTGFSCASRCSWFVLFLVLSELSVLYCSSSTVFFFFFIKLIPECRLMACYDFGLVTYLFLLQRQWLLARVINVS